MYICSILHNCNPLKSKLIFKISTPQKLHSQIFQHKSFSSQALLIDTTIVDEPVKNTTPLPDPLTSTTARFPTKATILTQYNLANKARQFNNLNNKQKSYIIFKQIINILQSRPDTGHKLTKSQLLNIIQTDENKLKFLLNRFDIINDYLPIGLVRKYLLVSKDNLLLNSGWVMLKEGVVVDFGEILKFCGFYYDPESIESVVFNGIGLSYSKRLIQQINFINPSLRRIPSFDVLPSISCGIHRSHKLQDVVRDVRLTTKQYKNRYLLQEHLVSTLKDLGYTDAKIIGSYSMKSIVPLTIDTMEINVNKSSSININSLINKLRNKYKIINIVTKPGVLKFTHKLNNLKITIQRNINNNNNNEKIDELINQYAKLNFKINNVLQLVLLWTKVRHLDTIFSNRIIQLTLITYLIKIKAIPNLMKICNSHDEIYYTPEVLYWNESDGLINDNDDNNLCTICNSPNITNSDNTLFNKSIKIATNNDFPCTFREYDFLLGYFRMMKYHLSNIIIKKDNKTINPKLGSWCKQTTNTLSKPALLNIIDPFNTKSNLLELDDQTIINGLHFEYSKAYSNLGDDELSNSLAVSKTFVEYFEIPPALFLEYNILSCDK